MGHTTTEISAFVYRFAVVNGLVRYILRLPDSAGYKLTSENTCFPRALAEIYDLAEQQAWATSSQV